MSTKRRTRPAMQAVTHVGCGGDYRRDANGRAVCAKCGTVTQMVEFIAAGISPMWDTRTRSLVTYA